MVNELDASGVADDADYDVDGDGDDDGTLLISGTRESRWERRWVINGWLRVVEYILNDAGKVNRKEDRVSSDDSSRTERFERERKESLERKVISNN